MKTHGEKRVRTILEVFHSVHKVLSHSEVESHLTVRLIPKFVLPLEHWIAATSESRKIPSTDDVASSLVRPLLDQIQIDVGTTLVRLAEGRFEPARRHSNRSPAIATHGRHPGSCVPVARRLLKGDERPLARGRNLLARLLKHLNTLGARDGSLHLLQTTFDLFFASPETGQPAHASNGHDPG